MSRLFRFLLSIIGGVFAIWLMHDIYEMFRPEVELELPKLSFLSFYALSMCVSTFSFGKSKMLVQILNSNANEVEERQKWATLITYTYVAPIIIWVMSWLMHTIIY